MVSCRFRKWSLVLEWEHSKMEKKNFETTRHLLGRTCGGNGGGGGGGGGLADGLDIVDFGKECISD